MPRTSRRFRSSSSETCRAGAAAFSALGPFPRNPCADCKAASSGRPARVVPIRAPQTRPLPLDGVEDSAACKRPVLRWADLLSQIHEIDIRANPTRGLGRLKPIAAILDLNAIATILDAMICGLRVSPDGPGRHNISASPSRPVRRDTRTARQESMGCVPLNDTAPNRRQRHHRAYPSIARARPSETLDPTFLWTPTPYPSQPTF